MIYMYVHIKLAYTYTYTNKCVLSHLHVHVNETKREYIYLSTFTHTECFQLVQELSCQVVYPGKLVSVHGQILLLQLVDQLPGNKKQQVQS